MQRLAVLVVTLSTAPFSELIRFQVSTRSSTGKGSLKETSIWSQNGQHIASCKYKRIIDTLPPSVPTTCL